MQLIEQLFVISLLTVIASISQQWGHHLSCREQFITWAQYAEISQKTSGPTLPKQICGFIPYREGQGWKWKKTTYQSSLRGKFTP